LALDLFPHGANGSLRTPQRGNHLESGNVES
jgi:hypothetical protein